MSVISTNLMRIHYAKAVADAIRKCSDYLLLRKLTKDLSDACVDAHNALFWNSVNINLRTVDRQIQSYSKQAYGSSKIAPVDGLRLIGMAIVQIEDTLNGQKDRVKRHALQRCLDTALEVNRFLDEELKEDDVYMEAAQDAKVFEGVLG